MIEPERDAPDLEDLAAYVDGRLSGERKARVEERLARDEDYYDVFLDTVRFQEEERGRRRASDGGGEVVAPAAWWRSRKVAVAAPAAAAAVLAAAIGLPSLMRGPSTGEWVARLDPAAVVDSPLLGSGKDWDDPDWQRSRGGTDPDLLRRQELAFRIGTRTVDLAVALAAGDRVAASGTATQLEAWTGSDDVLLILGAELTALRAEIDGGDLDAAAGRAQGLETLLAELLDGPQARYYALGRWNEAGRLAALAGDAEVLAGVYRRRRVARGIEEIEEHLENLEAALASPSPDFEAAQKAFSDIARELAGRG